MIVIWNLFKEHHKLAMLRLEKTMQKSKNTQSAIEVCDQNYHCCNRVTCSNCLQLQDKNAKNKTKTTSKISPDNSDKLISPLNSEKIGLDQRAQLKRSVYHMVATYL